MNRRVNAYLAAAMLAMIPTLAGCASSADVSRPSDTKDIARALKNKPEHVVQLEGRVPDSLQIELVALYVTDTKNMACFRHPGAKWGQGPNYHSEPISLARTSGRYEGKLIVDKYLPGACNWSLAQVNAVVKNIDSPDDPEVVEHVIHAHYFYHDESDASGCDVSPRSGDHRKCPVEENSLGTPVVVPCKVTSYSSDAQPKFDCPALTTANYKMSHRIKSGQKLIQIDFYDLDREPDPTK